MATANLLSRYMSPLLNGKRQVCREMVLSALSAGIEPQRLYRELIWPAMENVEKLFREDRINIASEHMATRINRTVADHLQSRLERKPYHGKRIVITSAAGEAEEFSAQMCADLFEADGWEVYHLGSGIPQDEIASLAGNLQPHLLMIVGSRPTDVPAVRQLIDHIREINAAPQMNIMVSGGVFNRAEALWEEVKADIYAEDAAEALEMASDVSPRSAYLPIAGAPKKRRRRRRPPLLVQAEMAC